MRVNERNQRVQEDGQPLVRDLCLQRRRSRTPWMFLVYHRRTGRTRARLHAGPWDEVKHGWGEPDSDEVHARS